MKEVRLIQFIKSIDLFILIIKSLLISSNNLNKNVINHCNKGLQILSIINADLSYNTGIIEIFEKKFDSFYDCFPNEEIKNREFIDIIMICKHIETCIDKNQIVETGKV